ncbi:MAG: phosphotransferase family protein [Microthrixaceae bacterium]
MAELRARTALRGAGLDPRAPLERASSVTNEVWLTPTHAVRVNRTHDDRLARETIIAASLPDEVGYPRIVARGGKPGEDWLVSERVPGSPLAHRWPEMDPTARHRAIQQLADRLRALHRIPAPADLPPLSGTPQLLEAGAVDPTAPLLEALEHAARLEHVDALVMQESIELVERVGGTLQPFTATTLVHGDVTFENVLWDGESVTALLDFEWARSGPPDLDLDIVLRCCAYPELHVAAEFEATTLAADYAEVPRWLEEAYPELFAFEDQLDRMRVYSIAYDVRELLAFPPKVEPANLSPLHPYHRLARVVRRRSYLDERARGQARGRGRTRTRARP